MIGGNLFAVKPEIGRYDALHGLALIGDGKGNFNALSSLRSGLKIEGEVRHIVPLQKKGLKVFAFIRNNQPVKFYSVNK